MQHGGSSFPCSPHVFIYKYLLQLQGRQGGHIMFRFSHRNDVRQNEPNERFKIRNMESLSDRQPDEFPKYLRTFFRSTAGISSINWALEERVVQAVKAVCLCVCVYTHEYERRNACMCMCVCLLSFLSTMLLLADGSANLGPRCGVCVCVCLGGH